jgi:transcriptional regulator with XRE-family HTH domain
MGERPSDFAQNLGLLCSYAPSIAEVCRQLGINRAQFNKYLAGTTLPARRNMRLICDHFGVSEWELHLPYGRFAEIVSLKPRAGGGPNPSLLPGYPDNIRENGTPLHERYFGYYFRYFYSNAVPGAVTRSLVRIWEKEGRVLWKNIEILRRDDSDIHGVDTLKYLGEVLHLSERIHVFEHETICGHNLCYVILYPAYRNNTPWLNGIQTWVSLAPGRLPIAASVTLESLGRQIDVRKALAACGVFASDSPDINPAIPERLNAISEPGDVSFAVGEL